MAREIPRRVARAVRLTAIFAVMLGAAPAMGATLAVDTAADELTPGDGLCSLREAVAAVDVPGAATDCTRAELGANTIVLGAQTYRLSIPIAGGDDDATGDLNVAANVTDLTIVGAGKRATTIDATGMGDRLLQISAGVSVTLSGVTLTGGHAPDGAPGAPGTDNPSGNGGSGGLGGTGANGGAIENHGSLTLTDAAVTDSRSGSGGDGGRGGSGRGGNVGGAGGNAGNGGWGAGIYNTGTVIATGTTISGNRAGSGGTGGIGGTTGVLSAVGGTGGNGGAGGGIADQGGTVTLIASTIAHNGSGNGGLGGGSQDVNAVAGRGGQGGGGTSGGGVLSLMGTLLITNSTIASNTAGAGGAGGNGANSTTGGGQGRGGDGGGGSGGGGLATYTDTKPSLRNVTLTGNATGPGGAGGSGGLSPMYTGLPGTAGTPGAGGGLNTGGKPATLQNSLLASNPGGNCASTADVTDGGHNLSFGDTSCPTSFASGDPKLRALGNNGGPADTIALGALSAAVDQVPAAGGGCPASDERGVPRPQGPLCDIGAYEVAEPIAVTGPASPAGDLEEQLTGTATANAGDGSARFEFGTSTAYGSVTPAIHVGGVASSAVAATLTGLVPVTTYHYRLVMSTVDGSSNGEDRTFTTPAPSGLTPGVAPVAAPLLGRLRLKPSRFHAAGKHPSARRVGTTVSYTDTQASVVTFAGLQVKTGVIKGKRCVVPPRHRVRGRLRACTRLVKVGSFTHDDRAGANSFRFNGRIRGRALVRGSYRLDATPRANGRTGRTVSIRFRIV